MCNMLKFHWSKYCFCEAGDLTLYLTVHECMTNYPKVKIMHHYLSQFLSWWAHLGGSRSHFLHVIIVSG